MQVENARNTITLSKPHSDFLANNYALSRISQNGLVASQSDATQSVGSLRHENNSASTFVSSNTETNRKSLTDRGFSEKRIHSWLQQDATIFDRNLSRYDQLRQVGLEDESMNSWLSIISSERFQKCYDASLSANIAKTRNNTNVPAQKIVIEEPKNPYYWDRELRQAIQKGDPSGVRTALEHHAEMQDSLDRYVSRTIHWYKQATIESKREDHLAIIRLVLDKIQSLYSDTKPLFVKEAKERVATAGIQLD